ncbi:hypothetical protein [Vibrio sp. J502]|nr:hypothetical protein [Vibrio sp. J502]UXH29854.1 hypothetical protein N5E84_00060 [Vibrio sp. J502]
MKRMPPPMFIASMREKETSAEVLDIEPQDSSDLIEKIRNQQRA